MQFAILQSNVVTVLLIFTNYFAVSELFLYLCSVLDIGA